MNLDTLKKIQLGDNECIYLHDLTNNKIKYKKGFSKFLGYDEKIITLEFLFKKIHPDDFQLVQRIIAKVILYCKERPEDSINNELFISFRHKTKSGDYIKVLQQISIYDVDEKGILNSLLVRLLDISFLDTSDYVSWNFIAHGLDSEDFKSKIYKYTKGLFTPRESELIHEIVKGYSNKRIGLSLNISEHTVATHRKNILRKSDCHKFIELKLFCKGTGIL